MAEKKINEHKGHRLRLRRQFINNGIESLYPHQVLELLLFYALPQKDTNGLAHALINRFGSLDKVFDADIEELVSVPGVGESTAIFLKAVSSVYAEYGQADAGVKIIIDNAFTADAYYSTLFHRSDGEQYGITVIDGDSTVFYTEKLSASDPSGGGIPMTRRIIEAAVKCNCTRCVICHFIPSGGKADSKESNTAAEIARSAKAMKITVEEYYLITDDSITAYIPRDK